MNHRHVAIFTILLLFSFSLSVTAQDDTPQWTSEELGNGIKPAIAIDNDDTLHIAYIIEEVGTGSVDYVTNTDDGWSTERVATGYFYGPLDIAVSNNGTPYITYHDHQDPEIVFDGNFGDAVVANPTTSGWNLTTIRNDGHDGWDNSIVIDNSGNWHTASIDPQQFRSEVGAEYATNAYSGVRVEDVPGGPAAYEFATSIDITNSGIVGVTYYSNGLEDLFYAERSAGASGRWELTMVDSEGDVGRYAHLIFDAQGNPHIAYFVAGEETGTGLIRYTWRDSSGTWNFEDVAEIDDLTFGTSTGTARKITSLAFDSTGTLHIAYTNRSEITYGTRTDDNWQLQIVTTAEDEEAILGSLVEMALDSTDQPHIVYYVLRGDEDEPETVVMYITLTDE